MTPVEAAVASRLLTRLFDDASQFPPGNLGLADAVAHHTRWRRSHRAGLVGRLLAPVGRAGQLGSRLTTDGAAWELGLVVPAHADPAVAAPVAEQLAATPARVSAVELPLRPAPRRSTRGEGPSPRRSSTSKAARPTSRRSPSSGLAPSCAAEG